MNTNYYSKYRKYKLKYLLLQNKLTKSGGGQHDRKRDRKSEQGKKRRFLEGQNPEPGEQPAVYERAVDPRELKRVQRPTGNPFAGNIPMQPQPTVAAPAQDPIHFIRRRRKVPEQRGTIRGRVVGQDLMDPRAMKKNETTAVARVFKGIQRKRERGTPAIEGYVAEKKTKPKGDKMEDISKEEATFVEMPGNLPYIPYAMDDDDDGPPTGTQEVFLG